MRFRRPMLDRRAYRCARAKRQRTSENDSTYDGYNSSMPIPHVVILGGGFGGLEAARALKNAAVRVTLLDRHNYHLFQPLLYQVATASLSPGDVASPIRWVLRRQANVTVLLAAVRAIDPVNKRVLLEEVGPANARRDDGGTDHPAGVGDHGRTVPSSIAYDYLIVATGATHAYFGHPEWAARAPGLKTLDDALEIRRQVLLAYEAAEREPDEAAQRRLTTFVIVGGGATGVELAGALAEIARQSLRQDFRNITPASARILLVEGGPCGDAPPSAAPGLPPHQAGVGAHPARRGRAVCPRRLSREAARRGAAVARAARGRSTHQQHRHLDRSRRRVLAAGFRRG